MSTDRVLLTFISCIVRIFPSGVRSAIILKAKMVRKVELQEKEKLPLYGRSTLAKRRRAKRLQVCPKCGKCPLYKHCTKNQTNAQYERVQWIKYGKSICTDRDILTETPFSSSNLNEHVQNEIGRFRV